MNHLRRNLQNMIRACFKLRIVPRMHCCLTGSTQVVPNAAGGEKLGAHDIELHDELGENVVVEDLNQSIKSCDGRSWLPVSGYQTNIVRLI